VNVCFSGDHFEWIFLPAKVDFTILGADSIKHFNLTYRGNVCMANFKHHQSAELSGGKHSGYVLAYSRRRSLLSIGDQITGIL
jgi:hypothetical protein